MSDNHFTIKSDPLSLSGLIMVFGVNIFYIFMFLLLHSDSLYLFLSWVLLILYILNIFWVILEYKNGTIGFFDNQLSFKGFTGDFKIPVSKLMQIRGRLGLVDSRFAVPGLMIIFRFPSRFYLWRVIEFVSSDGESVVVDCRAFHKKEIAILLKRTLLGNKNVVTDEFVKKLLNKF